MDYTKIMNECLLLAEKGMGFVAPNPMVGSIIIKDGEVIGKGYHAFYGGPHAEVMAIQSVKKKAQLQNSTLFVSLEPCAHYGKTPPCVDLIIQSGIKNVFVAALDSNPQVSGLGIKKLISAGIEVKTGILEENARMLNKRFYCFHEKKRPFIILKWAQTLDGYIGNNADQPVLKITGDETNKIVHGWRAEEQGILIGTKTALTDNPYLTNRLVQGNSPIRILLDRMLIVPPYYNIFNGDTPTIIFCALENSAFSKLDKSKYTNTKILNLEALSPHQIVQELFKLSIQSIIIEGGAQLLSSFIACDLWDEARIITSSQINQQGVKAPLLSKAIEVQKTSIGNEIIQYFLPF